MQYFSDTKWSVTDKVILLDVDGTIVADSSCDISRKTYDTVRNLQTVNNIYLCSNSSDHARITKLASMLGVGCIKMKFKKPSVKLLECIPAGGDIVVVGDKWLTDGLFALNINSSFIKVKTLKNGKEKLVISLINRIDCIFGRIILWIRRKF